MKIGRINSSQDGIIHDIHGEIQTLSAGHGNVPKILINEQIHNTIRPGHDADTQNGGGYSLTKKHCWDMVKVIQVNDSKESGGKQPYQQNRVYDAEGVSPTIDQAAGKWGVKVKSPTKEGFEEAKEGDSINYSMPNSKTRRGRVGVAQTLDTQVNQSVIVKAITETRTDEAKQIRKENMKNGKDFSPRRGKELKLRDDDNANTVTATQGIEQAVFIDYRIRRLSEVEVERLQGFPDNWTKFGIYEKQVWINKKLKTFRIVEGVEEISRTQRYKMCGNAVTVDVVKLIGLKLLSNNKD